MSRLFVFNLFQVNPLQVDWNNGEAQLTRANSLMALAAWMATVAKDIGRLGLTFTVGAAIVTVGFSVAMATGMRALLWLIHGLHAPDSKIKSVL